MICRYIIVMMALFLLVSCANMPDKKEGSFNLSARKHLYEKEVWFFSGRMSLTDKNHSISANVEWEHEPKEDVINLSGSFGLGRVRVVLAGRSVEINMDGRQEKYIGNVDDILSSELGIVVPVSALKYWVLGVADPNAVYKDEGRGFVQHGWRVSYLQMQANGDYELPRKIKAEQGGAKLKLIVSHWDI